MTEQFRACCVCFRCWTPIDGERKCPGCLGRLVPNNTAKRPTPTPLNLGALPDEPSQADIDRHLAAALHEGDTLQ